MELVIGLGLGPKVGLLGLGSMGLSLGLSLGLVHGFQLRNEPLLLGLPPYKGEFGFGSLH